MPNSSSSVPVEYFGWSEYSRIQRTTHFHPHLRLVQTRHCEKGVGGPVLSVTVKTLTGESYETTFDEHSEKEGRVGSIKKTTLSVRGACLPDEDDLCTGTIGKRQSDD